MLAGVPAAPLPHPVEEAKHDNESELLPGKSKLLEEQGHINDELDPPA